MPEDHTIATDNSSEPRFSEDDLDAALEIIGKRAGTLEDEIYAALMWETAEHFHRYLMEEC